MNPPDGPSDGSSKTQSAKDPIILHEMSGCIVEKISDSTVIKRGRRIIVDEKSGLDLAAELRLPVPRVYEALESDSGRGASIRMDFIDGEKLDNIWSSMNSDEKYEICKQLQDILKTMRSTLWTNGLIGSCSGGPARDCRRFSEYVGGPFPSEKAFNEFYLDLLQPIPKPIYDALRKNLRNDHRVVFSHGDLAQHNILVKDGKITGLIDWENSGWYPEYWDYIKFFDRPCKHTDWKNRADDIFPQTYEDELATHQAVLRWQRP